MDEYNSGLTAEPFLFNETRIIGKYLLTGNYNVKDLRKENIEKNLIQYKTKSSISRVNKPIFNRLAVFTKEQLNYFVNGELDQSKILLVYAIMKTDKLVREFVREIYYDKLITNESFIEGFEITKWFDSKIQNSDFLSKRSDSTKYKMKQVLTQIMTASGLLKRNKKDFEIIRPLISNEVQELLNKVNDESYYKTIGGLV